jgi:glycosyltransferase involved in cell wall biosynthesis
VIREALPTPCPVAVCIPAYGDPAGLAAVLRSLAVQDHPADWVDVVVAVDGPDRALEQVAERAGATVVVLPENGGSYAARNAAIQALPDRARVVLFTDADVVAPPGWITAHLQALSGSDLSGGAVRFTMSDPPTPAEWVDSRRHLQQRHYVEDLGFAASCNLGVRRDVLARVQFDASQRSGGDFLFGQHARQAGYTITFSDDAWIAHPARRRALSLLRKVDRVAAGAAGLAGKGYPATGRRLAGRDGAVASARSARIAAGPAWLATVFVLEQMCRLAYARRVPTVIGPALNRRLRGRT